MNLNDMAMVGHIIAGKTAQAVWGDKHFKQPIQQIKVKDDGKLSNESLKEMTLKNLQNKNLKQFQKLKNVIIE